MANSTSPNMRRSQDGVADTTHVAADSTAIAANAIVGSAKNQFRITRFNVNFIHDLLACDGSMIGLRRRFWFIRASWRRGTLRIDDEDMDFLINHVHGVKLFLGDHRPWWELRESWNGHWVVLLAEEGIIIMHDSLVQEHYARGKFRSRQASGICCVIPMILQHSGFYERHPDIILIDRFQIAVARWDLCYVQDDSTSCGAFSIRTLESLIQMIQ
ncbi:hypothetical protein OROHE_003571 [Orobanche hederae]